MDNITLVITGKVVDEKGKGLPNLRVEAWDKDLILDDIIGSAVTRKGGNFSVEFDEDTISDFGDRKPDVFFKIYDDDELIASTKNVVLWNIEVNDTILEITLKDAVKRSRAGTKKIATITAKKKGTTRKIEKYYEISGKVKSTKTNQGLSDLQIDVYGNKLQKTDPIRTDITSEQGAFHISIPTADLSLLFKSRIPQLYFKVSQRGQEIVSTENELIWKPENSGTEIIIPVELPAQEQYIVYGKVQNQNGELIGDVPVAVYDKSIAKALVKIKEGKTDREGQYEIDYSDKISSILGSKTPDLIVKATVNGKEVPSNLYIDAPKRAEINIVVSNEIFRGKSQFDALLEQIQSVFDETKIKEVASKEDFAEDAKYMAMKLKLPESTINHILHAYRLLLEADQLNSGHNIPVDVFFALLDSRDLTKLALVSNRNESALKNRLTQSIKKGIIRNELTGYIDAYVQKLRHLALIIAKEEPSDKRVHTARRLIKSSSLSAAQQEKFVEIHTQVGNKGKDQLWKAIEASELAPQLEEIQDLYTLAEITHFHAQLTEKLNTDRRNKSIQNIQHVRHLARKDQQWWETYLEQNNIILPNKPNSDDLFSIAEYAEQLTKTCKSRFPMVAFVQSLVTYKALPTDNELAKALQEFFENNPEFHFTKISVDDYWQKQKIEEKAINQLDNPGDPNEQSKVITDQERLKGELRTWARLYKLVSNKEELDEHAIALRKIEYEDVRYEPTQGGATDAGEIPSNKVQKLARKANKRNIASAIQIASLSKSDFFEKWLPVSGKFLKGDEAVRLKEGEDIYNRARKTVFTLSSTAWNVAAPLRKTSPALVSGDKDGKNTKAAKSQSVANFTTLFGTQDYRESEHCQSVLSPAAYYAELFHSMSQAAIDELAARRPDLLTLQLSCVNTNRKLPCIDLINEQLEWLVLEDTAVSLDLQTNLTEEELALQPEHVLDDAYVKLAKELYPLSLPWDKWFEESRLYLDYMGVPLYRLLELAISPIVADVFDQQKYRTNQLNDEWVVMALLGLSKPAYDLITQDIPDDKFVKVFPLAEVSPEHTEIPINYIMQLLDCWQDNLEPDPQSKEFTKLREILETRYIQDSRPNQELITIEMDEDNVSHQAGSVLNITRDTIVRLIKFERLRQSLEWSPHELHLAIQTFTGPQKLAANAINTNLLNQLSHLVRLQKRYEKLNIPELLSWWGPIETGAGITLLQPRYRHEQGETRFLYDKIFLDKSLFPVEEENASTISEKAYFTLNTARSELQYLSSQTGVPIKDHVSVVSAALRISASELGELVSWVSNRYKNTNNLDKLTLVSLSMYFRMVSLARALDITTRELVTAIKLTNNDPFHNVVSNTASLKTDTTILFVEAVQAIKDSPFSIQELAYLWCHDIKTSDELKNVYEQIDRWLVDLNSEISILVNQSENRNSDVIKQIESNLYLLGKDEHEINILKELLLSRLVPKKVLLPEFTRGTYIVGQTITSTNLTAVVGKFKHTDVKSLSTGKVTVKDDTSLPYITEIESACIDYQTGETWNQLSIYYRECTGVVNITINGQLVIEDSLRKLNEKIIGDVLVLVNHNVIGSGGTIEIQGKNARIKQFIIGGEHLVIEKTAFSRDESTLFYNLLNDQSPDYIASLLANLQQASDSAWGLELNGLSNNVSEAYIIFDYLRNTLAQSLEIEQKTVNTLITEVLSSAKETKPTSYLHDWILWLNGKLDTSIVREHLLRLQKLASIVNLWKLSAEEIEYFCRNSEQFSDFQWNLIPANKTAKQFPDFKQWEQLNAYVNVRNRISRTKNDLIVMFKFVTGNFISIKDYLALMFNISAQDISDAVKNLDYLSSQNTTLRHDVLRNGISLEPLYEIATQLKILGRPFSDAKKWVGVKINSNVGAKLGSGFTENIFSTNEIEGIKDYKNHTLYDIRKTAKTRCGESQWATIGKGLQDKMRIAQRDRLLPYAKYSSTSKTYEQVYGKILFDPEMDPCFETTRLKQAISSLQLFIQRVRSGLEDQLTPNQVPDLHWKWMKNYRVWEAAKKVFLFPENWIEPELRHNKTPFFAEFEDELSQGELDEKSIAKAFRSYMNKVDEISNLEVAAFKEHDSELHVIGRTREKPRRYYYRKRVKDIWFPWERIDLDIETEVVLTTVYNDQLYLLWPTIKEEVVKLGQDNDRDKNNDKNNYLPVALITLNWSIFKDGVWSSRCKADDPIVFMYGWHYQDLYTDPLENLTYIINSDNGFIEIKVACMANDVDVAKRITWNEDALTFELERFRELVGKIDWAYINGSSFRLGSADMLEMVEGHLKLQEMRIKGNLYQGKIDEALNKSDDLAYFEDNGIGNPHYPVTGVLGGILKWHFYDLPLLYDNIKTDRSTPWPKGLKTSDYEIIVDTFKSYRIDEERIGLRGAKYRYLNIGDRAADRREEVSLYGKEHYEFGRFLLNGNGKECQVYNALGIIQKKIGKEEWRPVKGFNKQAQVTHSKYSSELAFDVLSKDIVIYENSEYKLRYHLFDYGVDENYLFNFEFNNNGIKLRYHQEDLNIDANDLETFPRWRYTCYVQEYDRWSFKDMSLISTEALVSKITWDDEVGLKRYFYHDNNYCFMFAQEKSIDYQVTTFCAPNLQDLYRVCETSSTDSSSEEIFYLGIQAEKKPFPYNYVFDNSLNIHPDNIEFSFKNSRPFGIYNWEIFFHIPLSIAVRLTQQKKFEHAQKWFHCIFNPLENVELPNGGSDELPQAARYWNVLPLHQLENPQDGITDIINERATYLASLEEDPFQPHRIAQGRQVAYQKAVVIKYLDNLIAWGDYLFEKDTIESINEATQIYLLAGRILGPRPRQIPLKEEGTNTGSQRPFTAQDIVVSTDYLELLEGEALVTFNDNSHAEPYYYTAYGNPVSQWFITSKAKTSELTADDQTVIDSEPAFAIPHNNKMLGYWDTIADRLFKIRHCRNIEGRVRELPLFEPPIDPALLVRGQALGIDIADLLSEQYTPLPPYRFRVMLQKALEFCGDLRNLGGQILSAIEKQDGEALALLRARHERTILDMSKDIKTKNIKELRENIKATRISKDKAAATEEYYLTRKFEIRSERLQVQKLGKAHEMNIASQIVALAASGAYAAPQFIQNVQTGSADLEYGGRLIGDVLSGTSKFLSLIGSVYSYEANLHSIQAGHERRMDDWLFQAEQAKKDVKQIEKQILASEIRLEIAEKELQIHKQQQSNAEDIEIFLENKFSNAQLYHWMIGQLSSIYFQMYRMTVEMARTAQRCYRYESGNANATFISVEHWDNLKKGLLAGDKLQYELRQMERDYYQNNSRDLELVKDISLRCLDPFQLDKLRFTGSCEITIPELLFDLDYPGHYFRRIKSLSISIPSIVGPYSVVNCTLEREQSWTRAKPESGSDDDVRTPDISTSESKVVLSKGQNDSGVFELNHNDEKYLPFELCGVDSKWKLSFTSPIKQFDYSTISDVIFHMRYTAKWDFGFEDEVKTTLENTFAQVLKDSPSFLALKLDIRRDFHDLWHKFINSPNEDSTHEFSLQVTEDWFPYLIRAFENIKLTHLSVFCEFRSALTSQDQVTLQSNRVATGKITLANLNEKRVFTVKQEKLLPTDTSDAINISINGRDYPVSELKEMILIVHFEL